MQYSQNTCEEGLCSCVVCLEVQHATLVLAADEPLLVNGGGHSSSFLRPLHSRLQKVMETYCGLKNSTAEKP